MVGKKNKLMREKKLGIKNIKYSIRKLKFGTFSCAIKNIFNFGVNKQQNGNKQVEDDDEISDTTKRIIQGAIAFGVISGG